MHSVHATTCMVSCLLCEAWYAWHGIYTCVTCLPMSPAVTACMVVCVTEPGHDDHHHAAWRTILCDILVGAQLPCCMQHFRRARAWPAWCGSASVWLAHDQWQATSEVGAAEHWLKYIIIMTRGS